MTTKLTPCLDPDVSSRCPLYPAAKRARVQRPEPGSGVMERGSGPELPESPEQRGC